MPFVLDKSFEDIHPIILGLGYTYHKREGSLFKDYYKPCPHGRYHLQLRPENKQTLVFIHYDKFKGNTGFHKSKYNHPYVIEEQKKLKLKFFGGKL